MPNRCQAGLAARAGLESALMARAGMTGQPHVIDDARGFAGLMGSGTEPTFDIAFNRLGRPWALEQYGVLLKPWPSCSCIHRLMTAAFEISLADGSAMHTTCSYPVGAPQRPMSEADLAAKYTSITGRPADRFNKLLNWPQAGDVAAYFRRAARCNMPNRCVRAPGGGRSSSHAHNRDRCAPRRRRRESRHQIRCRKASIYCGDSLQINQNM